MSSPVGRADTPGSQPALAALGDRALVLRYEARIGIDTSRRVLAARQALERARLPGVVDLVPAYASLCLHYDWSTLPEAGREQPWLWLADAIRSALASDDGRPDAEATRRVEIPVCYQGEHAPDLDAVAETLGLSGDELIRRHCAARYRVAFLGFRPGFPYLLGLDPALVVPRLATPRMRVPAGSVGIGNEQTGIYPGDGPGGWQLIGATPLRLFDPQRAAPALLAPGDEVRFIPIDQEAFRHAATTAAAPDPDAAKPVQAVLDVVHPGIHASIQDLGRQGWRHLGIGASGAADPIAAAMANALVGNPASAAVLELTLRGPELRLRRTLCIALAGSGMDAHADDQVVPFGRPVLLAAGTHLRFRSNGQGARSWLAVAGGLAAPRWLGSSSTDFGSGVFGRSLVAGDALELAAATPLPALATGERMRVSRWWIDARAQIDAPMILRYLPDDEADPAWRHELPERVWQVGTAADRTGLRLQGPALSAAADGNRISAGVLYGSIQVPADGQPIMLGPDGQTTGGYPVAGHVIEADLPRLAQLKPGDLVWLQPTSLEHAHHARVTQHALVTRSRLAIAQRIAQA